MAMRDGYDIDMTTALSTAHHLNHKTFKNMTAKQQALEAIRRLPDKASFKTIAYELELLAAIREADEDIKRGRVIPIAKVRRMIPKWISRSSLRKAQRGT